MVMAVRYFHSFSANFQFKALQFSPNQTHYQKIGVARNATSKDIRKKFKQLSKQYHPDIVSSNPSISDEAKKQNNEGYIELIGSYEVLSDHKKRDQYDLQMGLKLSPRSDARTRYYGEAKYYSRAGNKSTPSGMNFSRGRVHFGAGLRGHNQSTFHGMPNNNKKDDVPHFDYDKHLKRHLKFEERMLTKKMEELAQEAKEMLKGDVRYQGVYRRMKKSRDGE